MIRSAGRRLVPLDVFVAFNIVLFLMMCVFTYYARFVHYRGAANVWEFFVYASFIITAILLAGALLRRYAFGAGLLVLVQFGILIHFAGAFVQFDARRLYDCYVAGIRYDKLVHFTNAFIAVLVVRHITVRRGAVMDGVTRLTLLLVVLGLGAVVEIMEYIVCTTVPGTGVGGYDNNMQDLIENMVGGALAAFTCRPAARHPHLHLSTTGARQPVDVVPSFERALNAVELVAFVALCLGLSWFGSALVDFPWFVPAMQVTMVAGLFYVLYVSPVRLHHDSLAVRGLGTWRTLFIRTDNLPVAARRFGWLALAGTTLILLLAEMWNPGWFARADWKAWGLRATLYLVSASFQELVFVGFCLVRLRRLLEPRLSADIDRRQQFLIAMTAAVLFGVLHMPSPALTALTTVFGFAVAWICLRTPNVFAVAGCQALLGLLLHRVLELPPRIGAFYYHQDLHPLRSIVPLVKQIIGNLY